VGFCFIAGATGTPPKSFTFSFLTGLEPPWRCYSYMVINGHLWRRSATADSSCGEFVCFELEAQSLEIRSKSFNLLLLLGSCRLLFGL
jgi:hypothetical protein